MKVGCALMLNILGQSDSMEETKAPLVRALGISGAGIHWYGKGDSRAGRKMAHVTVTADAIFGHAQLQKVKKEKADTIEVVHQEVLAGGRDFASASVELDRLGVTATQKRGYLIRWGQERQKRIPDFPVALLEKLAAQKLLTADTATFYLQNQGYTPEQIMLLLRLWDITAAEKAAKKAVSPAGGSPAKLNRRDYETLYLGDRNRRQEAFLGLRAIGYSESAATFILDAIDRTRI